MSANNTNSLATQLQIEELEARVVPSVNVELTAGPLEIQITLEGQNLDISIGGPGDRFNIIKEITIGGPGD